MKSVNIKLSNLYVNEGQIEGLPANPRFIREDKLQKLKQSLIEDPEMLAIRELIVYPHPTMTGNYIVIGGNMRYNAAKELGMTELPCKILPNDTPVEKMRAYIIKDNLNYGEWNTDLLINDWGVEQLQDWGVDELEDWGVDAQSTNPVSSSPIVGAYSPLNTQSVPGQESDPTAIFQDALPPELQGADLIPANLPKIQGSDETAMERIIIVYPKEQYLNLCSLLGLPSINKVVYRLEEIMPELAEE